MILKKPKHLLQIQKKGGYKNHWGIRTGTGTEIIDAIIYNNESLENIDALKMELAKNNTYIPVYSMEGNLLYSYE